MKSIFVLALALGAFAKTCPQIPHMNKEFTSKDYKAVLQSIAEKAARIDETSEKKLVLKDAPRDLLSGRKLQMPGSAGKTGLLNFCWNSQVKNFFHRNQCVYADCCRGWVRDAQCNGQFIPGEGSIQGPSHVVINENDLYCWAFDCKC